MHDGRRSYKKNLFKKLLFEKLLLHKLIWYLDDKLLIAYLK